jgi:hypothetical protein
MLGISERDPLIVLASQHTRNQGQPQFHKKKKEKKKKEIRASSKSPWARVRKQAW